MDLYPINFDPSKIVDHTGDAQCDTRREVFKLFLVHARFLKLDFDPFNNFASKYRLLLVEFCRR